jgi:hypothetical protein
MTQASPISSAAEDDELDQVEAMVDAVIASLGDRVLPDALPAIRMALTEFYFTNDAAIDVLAELRRAPSVAGSGERVRHAEDALLAAMTRRTKRAQGGGGEGG